MDKEYFNKYYKEHKKDCIASIRKYQSSTKGINKINEYKEANKEKISEWRRKYEKDRIKKDKTIVIKKKFLVRLRRLVKIYLQTGIIKDFKVHAMYKLSDKNKLSEYERILIGMEGIDYKGIIEYLKPFPKYFLKNYQIDHIKPLCSFDFNTPEGIKECFKPENHQILLIKDNQSKGKH